MHRLIKKTLGVLCSLILVFSGITALWNAGYGQWEGEFPVSVVATIVSVAILFAVRDTSTTGSYQPQPPHDWDPRTIESAKRRSEGIE